MQAQATQAAQTAVMTARDWYPILIGAASAILAAFGAVFLTLKWQARQEKRDSKLNLFTTLMMHRKADPPNQAWVNALNLIDVVFYDSPKVLECWHKLYSILSDEPQVGTEAHRHQYISMLYEMGKVLDYANLQQIDIDKFYSPKIYAQQAQVNAMMQGEIMAFFRNAGSLMQKQGEKTVEQMVQISVDIVVPEDNSAVHRKHNVHGYVNPAAANVQVLVFAGDELWYPQTPILRDGAKWKVKATFGNEEGGGSFKLIAIVSATEITQPERTLPPDSVKSAVVRVTRSTTILPPPSPP
jgi:hypothetical protein